MKIIKRTTAIERGLPHYYTGIACKRGHLAYRYTDSASCSDCHRDHARESAIRQRMDIREKRRRHETTNG